MRDVFNHHAYCVEGGAEEARAFARALVEGAETEAPEVHTLIVPSFSIDDARELQERASRAPTGVGARRQCFVLAADVFTREAQNALLKVFEEPTTGTHFFVFVRHADLLLPTLRSRMEDFSLTPSVREKEKKFEQEAAAFLHAPLSERLARARRIADALADEKMTRGEAIAFVSALARAAPGEATVRAENYAFDRSPSFKLLLEHLAIVLPRKA